MNYKKFIYKTVDEMIEYLSKIPKVSKNQDAMSRLPSFKNFEYICEFIPSITPLYERNKEDCLDQLIHACYMNPNDFTDEERKRFMFFLKKFVLSINTMYGIVVK